MGPISRGSLMVVSLGVIVRESGRFQYSAKAVISNQPRGVLDAPLSRGMTRAFSIIPGRLQSKRPGNLEIRDQPASRPVRNDWTSDPCHFHHQIGQPLGGI